MGFSLDHLLPVLMKRGKVTHHFNPSHTEEYNDIVWLGYRPAVLKEGYVYVGHASMLPNNFDVNQSALILINDCDIDFSNCHLEVVIMNQTPNMEELYTEIREQVLNGLQMQGIAENLLDMLLAEKSIKKILDFSYSFLRNPIVVFGGDANVVCFSSSSEIKEQIPTAMKIGADRTDRASFVSALSREYKSLQYINSPVLIEDGHCFPGKRRIAISFSVDSKLVGSVALFEINGTFTQKDYDYLKIISKAISSKLAAPGFQQDFYGLQFEQNMIDLLNGNKISIKDNRWLAHVNGHLYQSYMVAVVNIHDLNYRQCEDLKAFIGQRLFFSSTVIHGDNIVVLVNPKNKHESITLRQILSELIGRFSVEVGLSDTFKEISNLKIYYTQALRTREFGRAMGRKDEINEFEKFKLYILLKEIASKVELRRYISHNLEILMQYDAKENTEYWQTLHTFIKCGKHRQKTCEALNIHKNTLSYRLDKITELLGCSLTDGDLLLDIYFSSMIQDVLRINALKGYYEIGE